MRRTRDIGGIFMSAVFILVGVAVLWDTTRMLDRDSYVYPRAVAVLMIIFCLAYIGRQLLRPPRQHTESLEAQTAQKGGSTARRVGLVATLFACALVMPYVGFLISGAVSFAVMMLIAMYDPWTRFRLVVYPAVAAALVLGFYFLFKVAFLVPLPDAPFL
jgi:putative tricarboxylic transport membrane protein